MKIQEVQELERIREEFVRNGITIFPSMTETPNGLIPTIAWFDNPPAEIAQACLHQDYIHLASSSGLARTPSGAVSWLLICLALPGRDNSTPALFWVDVILSPEHLTGALAEWLAGLKAQNLLAVDIPLQDAEYQGVLMRDLQVQGFVEHLEESVALWNPATDNYPEAAGYWREYAREQCMKSLKEAIFWRFQGVNGIEVNLLSCVAQEARFQTSPDSVLYRLGLFEDLDGLQSYLEEWRSHISPDCFNELLSSSAQDTSENICRDWLFAQRCLELSRERSKEEVFIAVGLLPGSESWCLRKLHLENTLMSELLMLSRHHRFLLRRQWREILQPKDLLFGERGISLPNYLGKVPQRKQFHEVKRILTLAVLEKSYTIEGLTTIELNKPGCEEITYFPTGPNACLFKVTVKKNKDHNDCLVGEIEAQKGRIEFIGAPIGESLQGYLKLLLFLVAVAYRDLVVVREPFGKDKSSNAKSKRVAKGTKEPVRYVARFKGKINEQLADPQQFVKNLRKIAPHIRVGHLRELPEGQKGSELQKQIGETYGFLVPEGKTFVRPAKIGHTEEDLEVMKKFRSISITQVLLAGE